MNESQMEIRSNTLFTPNAFHSSFVDISCTTARKVSGELLSTQPIASGGSYEQARQMPLRNNLPAGTAPVILR